VSKFYEWLEETFNMSNVAESEEVEQTALPASAGAQSEADAPRTPDFRIMRHGDRWVRLAPAFKPPADAEIVDIAAINAMDDEAIGKLYGEVGKVSNKKFKHKGVAVESTVYQIMRMKIWDPDAPETEATAVLAGDAKARAAKKERKASAAAAPKVARGSSKVYELLSPPDSAAVLGKLPPQARELVLMLTEVAAEAGSTKIAGAAVIARMSKEDAVSRLRTVQPAMRILGYYTKQLEEAGLLKVA
jgi:hypothetical protein